MKLLRLISALGDACAWLVMGIGFWLTVLTGPIEDDEDQHDEVPPPPE